MLDYPFTITNESVTVIIDGETHTVKAGDPNFEKARDAVLAKNWSQVPKLLSRGLALANWAGGLFTFRDNRMTFRGEPLPDGIHTRMLAMAEKNEDPSYLMRFWQNLSENPSWRSVDQLWDFLKNQGIPIDEDGYIIAYKSVQADYKDKYTSKVSNHVGAEIEMPRNKISDDPTLQCHFGYHAGALKYARDFYFRTGDRIIVVRINPRDVVCIPNDHSFQKMRVCKYVVLGNFGDILPDTIYNLADDEAIFPKAPDSFESSDEDDFEDDFEDVDDEDDDEDEDEDDVEETTPVTTRIVDGWFDRKRPTASEIAQLEGIPLDEVALIPIDALRRFAVSLGITGASKFRKDDLVPMVGKALEDRRPKVAVEIPHEGRLTDEELVAVDALSDTEITELPMSVLRQYASRKLHIIGASKLRKFNTDDRGRENGLVARIIDVRRR